MTVKIETDAAQVATYFTGLQDASTTGREIVFFERIEGDLDAFGNDQSHHTMTETTTSQQSVPSSTDSLDTAEVRLDIKKFSQLLHSQQPYAEKMVFSTFKLILSSISLSSFRFLQQQYVTHLYHCRIFHTSMYSSFHSTLIIR